MDVEARRMSRRGHSPLVAAEQKLVGASVSVRLSWCDRVEIKPKLQSVSPSILHIELLCLVYSYQLATHFYESASSDDTNAVLMLKVIQIDTNYFHLAEPHWSGKAIDQRTVSRPVDATQLN